MTQGEKFAYLQLIDGDKNNNRFYRMRVDGPVIIVEFGRNGATPVVQKKPLSLWDSIYNKKISEGYIDVSDVHNVTVKEVKGGQYAAISDEDVRVLFDALMHYANRELDTQYRVSWDEVTQEMIDRAQSLIAKIDKCQSVEEAKPLFLELFAVIPRKMKDVRMQVPDWYGGISAVLDREQDLLDVLKAKIATESKTSADKDERITILEALGLEARLCTPEEEQQIKKYLSAESAPRFKKAFRIKNQKTDKRFEDFMQKNHLTQDDISYLYHGSRNQNYFGLITEGPLLNPNAPITGKMFGHGIYFANRAKKSINYTSLYGSYWAGGTSKQGFLAVYKVCYKNPKHIEKWSHDMTSYTGKRIAPYDAVFAHGGADLVNDEIVIYDEAQCTLQYLIELH